MGSIRTWLQAALLAASSLLAGTAAAQTYDHSVYLDLDNNAATGCNVATAAGPVNGAELRITATVTGTPPMVTATTRASCAGGVFGAAQPQSGSYAVGLNNGINGADVIEMSTPLAGLAGGPARATFVSSPAGGADQVSGIVQLPGGGNLSPIAPILVPATGLLTLLLLAGLVFFVARRHPGIATSAALLLMLGAGVVWAANFVVDGQVGDWAGVPPLAMDANNDATNGDTRIEIVAVFAATEAGNLFLRLDVRDAQVPTNTAPVANDINFSVPENSAAATAVGTVAATDANAGQVLTYSITAGNASGAFAINAATGAITVANATPLNFETTPNFALTVTVTDNGTPVLSDTATVMVSLTDVNEAPVLADATRAVAEDSPAGTQVGAPLGGSDPDAGDPPATWVYAITAGNTNGAFAISNAGQITVANAAAITSTGTFTLTVTLTDDSGLSDPATVTVNVTDQNDAPQFTGAPYAFSLAENSAAGTAVGNAPATDADAGQVVAYAITGGNTGGAFAISASGQITVANAAAINFETTPSFTLTLTATDNGAPPLSATTSATITLTNVNEAPTAADAAFAVPENAPPATNVGGVVATDPDTTAPNSTLAYAITAGNTGNVFAINAATGVISTAGVPVLANSPYTLTVTVTDGGAVPLSDTATVVITVTDQNDAPTLNDAVFALPENSANGTAVGSVTATDPDAGQAFTYAITAGNGAGGFAINPATGAITVANSAALDFETTPVFTLTVSATDNGVPPLADTAQVTINLTNANDAPVAPDAAMSVAENAANATVVGTYTATDVDAGQTLSYAITAGNTGGAFAINAAGQVTVANSAALNFEATPSFALTITATDNGAPVRSDTGVLTVTVTDANEAPVAADAAFNVAQDSAAGTPVGTATATDVDAGANGTRTFAITAGNTGTAFAIDANSGAITVATQAQMTVGTVFTLTITVTDGGTPGLTDTATVTITVTDVNEAPVPTSTVASPISLAENSAPGTAVTTIVPNDPDAGQTHIYAFQSGNTGGAFTISPAGVITVAGPLDFEGATPSYVLTVRVTDNGAPPLFADIAVTVNLTNVNEAPVVGAGGTLSYQESDPATAIDSGITVVDPDAGEGIESGTVQITANYVNGQDVLALPAQPIITGVFSAATGTLTLSGTDTPAAYQAALRSVTYFNTSGSPSTANRTVTWIVNDNPLASAPATSTIVINSTNSPPTINSTAPAVATEDTLYTYSATRLDSDGPSQAWTVSASNTCSGASIVGATGVYTFTPTGPVPPATCVVAVQVCDNGTPNLCATQSTTVSITPVNDAPGITSLATATATEDVPYNYAPTFSDPDGTGQTWSLLGGHTCGGSINAGSGAFSFTPAGPNPPASCTLSIQVCDNGPLCGSQTATITITPVNSVPVISSTAPTTATEDLAYTYNATRNDPDGPAQAWSLLGTHTCGGTIGAGTGAFTFTPTGPVPPASCVVAIQVCDNGTPNECAQQTSTVTITAVNDQPVINSTAPTTATEDATYTYNATINDPDGVSQSWSLLGTHTCGGSIVAGTGVFTFTPPGPNPPPTCVVAIQACDNGTPNLCANQSTTVAISGVNDGPVNTVPGPQGFNEDTTLVFSAGNSNQLSIIDGDATTMSVQVSVTNGVLTLGGTTGLSFTLGDGTSDATMAFSGSLANVQAAIATLTYTPTLNFFGSSTLTFTSNDGGSSGSGGALGDTDTVAITVIPVNDAPTAVDEIFETLGNTELRLDVAAVATPHVFEATAGGLGVRNNDSDPVESDPTTVTGIVGCADAVAPFDCTLASGSVVSMNANGTFSFRPSPTLANGTPTADTFTYTLTDIPAAGTAASDPGTVTINVFEKIWYVRRAAGGNGRSDSPLSDFSSLAANSGTGDYIFVHNDATALNSSITLKANQRLLGEGAGLSVPLSLNGNPSPTVLVAAGTRSPVTSAAAATVGVTNAMPIEIRGLSLAATAGNAIDVTTSAAALTGSPTLTISGNDFTGSGAEGIDVNAAHTGTLTLSITNNTWTGTHAGNAIDIANTSATADSLRLDLSANTLLSSAGGLVVGGGAVARTTITGFGGNSVNGNTGGLGMALSNVTFDATPGGAINKVTGGITSIGQVGNPVGGAGFSVTASQGNLFFNDLDVFSAAGTALAVNGAGSGLTFGVTPSSGGGSSRVDADNGAAVDASNVALDLRLAQLDSTTAAGGVALATVTGQFSSAAGVITKSSGAGTAFLMSGSNAIVDYLGSLNVTAGAGVALTSNAGSTISFRGGMTLSTGGSDAFTATGGGTLEVCDEAVCNAAAGALANTLATTTGIALNVANTTIGANDLEFRSISANGASSGIVLNTTGNLGGLVVRGTGAANSGGTIQSTTSHGVSLVSTTSPMFTSMLIQNTGGSGINGTGVAGFSFVNGTITGSGNALGEGNITFNGNGTLLGSNFSGALTVTGNTLNTAFDHGLQVQGDAGTISDAVISNNSFTSSTAVASSQGTAIQLVGTGNASTVQSLTKATITNNVIRNFPSGAGIQVLYGNSNATGPAGRAGTAGSAIDVVTITGNNIQGQNAVNRMNTSSILVAVSGGNGSQRSQGNFVVSNNGTAAAPIGLNVGSSIGVGNNGFSTMTSVVNNNFILSSNSLASNGAGGGNGVVVGCVAGTCESPDLTLASVGNNISQTDGNGILWVARGNAGIAKFGIRTNTVAAPLTGVRPGIRVDAGNTAAAGSDDAVCMEMAGNTSGGSGGHEGIGLRKQGTVPTTHDFGVEGMAATASPQVEQYVGNTGQNPGTANGSFGTAGVLLLSAASGFSNCNTAP
jgi:VCBS repeat-containing protein